MKKVLLVICFVMLATFGITFNIEPVYASEAVFNDKVVPYNGEEQSILVEGLPEGTEVAYANNVGTIPGIYEASATYTDESGIKQVLTATLTIKPAIITGITLPSKSFTYDGDEKSLEVNTLTLPYGELAEVEYANNNQTEANSEGYVVTATVTHPYYETLYLTSELYITPAEYELSGVTLEDAIFDYDANEHSLAYKGTLPNGLSVQYSNNNKTNAGYYLVEMSFINENPNYITPSPMYAYLIINPKAIEVVVDEMTFNRTTQNISYSILGAIGEEDPKVSLSQTTVFNAGYYNINVNVANTNYVPKQSSITVHVAKATITDIEKPYPTITYFEGIKLKDIRLRTGFTWINEEQLINCNDTEFEAIYNIDPINYEDAYVTITVEIRKASINAVFPEVGSIEYGSQLRDVKFDSYHTLGVFQWKNETLYPTVVNTGYIMELIPYDTVNYLSESKTINVIVTQKVLDLNFANYEDVVYNGTQQKNVTATISGMFDRDQNSIQLRLIYDGDAINAGVYKVEASINNSNYALPAQNYVNFNILKADLDVDEVSFVVGSDKVLFSQSVSYKLGDGNWVTSDSILLLNENTDYQISYYLVGDRNYNDSSIKVVNIRTTYSVQTVNNMIDQLGVVTLDSYDEIVNVIYAYNTLLEEDKQLVNTNTFTIKLNQYNDLCDELNNALSTQISNSEQIWKAFLVSLSVVVSAVSLLFVARRFV